MASILRISVGAFISLRKCANFDWFREKIVVFAVVKIAYKFFQLSSNKKIEIGLLLMSILRYLIALSK